MIVAGVKGISLIDYPQKVATVLYLNRCNFRCPYCHNKELVLGKCTTSLNIKQVLGILAARHGFIDGVVITGGEPTVHQGLSGLVTSIKKLGLSVKLDTNGYNPEVLKLLLADRAIDYVAMDIKTSWKKYSQATGVPVNVDRLIDSVNLIKQSGVEHEFRTTCVPYIVDEKDIEEISSMIDTSGLYTLQQYQPLNTLSKDYRQIIPYSRAALMDFMEIARRHTSPCRLVGQLREMGSIGM